MDQNLKLETIKQKRELQHVIGASVKRIRKERQMNQTELGRVLALEQAAISRIESGHQHLSAAELLIFCHKMGVPAEVLLNLGASQ